MAIIVVGGSGKGVGKTALVCGLIAALPEFRWTAIKISSHQHPQPELAEDQPIWEETVPGQGTDTARYLAAGAERALLVTVRNDDLPLGQIWEALGSGADVIFESNSIMAHLRPDLCLGVSGTEQTKTSQFFQHFMLLTDALVVRADVKPVLSEPASAKPMFRLPELQQVSPEMLAWVRQKLCPAPSS